MKEIPSFVRGNTTVIAVRPKWEDMDAQGCKTLTDADLTKVSDMSVTVVSTFGKRYEMAWKLVDTKMFSIDLVDLPVGNYGIEVRCTDAEGMRRRYYAEPNEFVRIVNPTSKAYIPTDGTVNEMYDMSITFSLLGAASDALTRAEASVKAADDALAKADDALAKAKELSGKADEALTLATEAKATADKQAETLTATNASVTEAEALRASAEQKRTGAETGRVGAENARASDEAERQNNENARQANEETRKTNETARVSAEEARSEAETGRVNAEQARDTVESYRASAETERATAETARKEAETSRAANEQARQANEDARKANEAARADEEAKRAAAESARAESESNRGTAETSRAAAEVKRATAETARAAAEQNRETSFATTKKAVEDATSAAVAKADTATANANAATANAQKATEAANTAADRAKAVVEDYKQNVHEHLTIILTTDNNNDGALKGAVVSIKYQNSNMETARTDTLTWDGEPLKTDITAGMMYTVSTSKVSGYDYVTSLENITAIGGYDRSVTLRYANAVDKEKTGQIYINPASGSATLHRENVDTLNTSLAEYLSKGFPCVMDAGGNRMAKIKSATFEGNYDSGMTKGTVTFMDGTICDINMLNEKGCNWMVYRPELFFSSWVNETGDEILSFGGNLKVTGGYSFKEKFVGMFKAYNQNGVLKSQPNRIPTGSQTIASFQSQAKAGAEDYGIWNYEDWCKENALHLAYFHHTNYETNIGIGRINNYNYVRNIVTGFTLPLVRTDKPYGKVATVDSAGNTVNCLNFFNIEGLGEQIWEFVNGIRHDETTYYVWSDNQWSEGHEAERTFPFTVTNANSSYIKFIKAGEYFDVIPKDVNASSTTGYCDGHWAYTTGGVLYVGGNADGGSLCGLSASAADNGFSFSYDDVGSRLAFFGEPTEVEGAKLIATLV